MKNRVSELHPHIVPATKNGAVCADQSCPYLFVVLVQKLLPRHFEYASSSATGSEGGVGTDRNSTLLIRDLGLLKGYSEPLGVVHIAGL